MVFTINKSDPLCFLDLFSEIKKLIVNYSKTFNNKFTSGEIIIYDTELLKIFTSDKSTFMSDLKDEDSILLKILFKDNFEDSQFNLRFKKYIGFYGYTPVFFEIFPNKIGTIDIYEKGTLLTTTPKFISNVKYKIC